MTTSLDTRFPGTGIIGPKIAGKEKGELKIAHARNFDIRSQLRGVIFLLHCYYFK